MNACAGFAARIAVALTLCAASHADAAPAMWVARDSDTEVTLFGTVHALPKGTQWQTPALLARLDAADTLVLEAIMPADPMALAGLIANSGMLTVPKPLAARLPPDVAAKVPAAIAASGIPAAGLDRMESWLAAITLSEATLARAGVTPGDGVEPQLERRARTAGKPVIGLETAEQQLRYLDGLPAPDQTALLAQTVAEATTATSDAAALVAAWQAGDLDRIAREFGAEAAVTPTMHRVLLTDRNRRWSDWIAAVMRRPGKVFVAVGAAHLGGPDGLIALLRARGLTLAPAE